MSLCTDEVYLLFTGVGCVGLFSLLFWEFHIAVSYGMFVASIQYY